MAKAHTNAPFGAAPRSSPAVVERLDHVWNPGRVLAACRRSRHRLTAIPLTS
jgi:hypothetical protein